MRCGVAGFDVGSASERFIVIDAAIPVERLARADISTFGFGRSVEGTDFP